MHSIRARNVNVALAHGLRLMMEHGVATESRNGPVMALPEPMSTRYSRPWERVLLSSLRNANPYFHFMESMWMLAGRNDVAFVSQYVKRMADFSDDGITFHGAYGYRWTYWFNAKQIPLIVEELNRDPLSRRAVLQMWDPQTDLTRRGKDLPCNLCAVFDCRDGSLNMTVYNRSNDMILGAYGANAVHFSFLQQFVAECLGVKMGWYEQVSHNMHVYLNEWPQAEWYALAYCAEKNSPYKPHVFDGEESMLIVNEEKHALISPRLITSAARPAALIAELRTFCTNPNYTSANFYKEPFVFNNVIPMQLSWNARKVDINLALHWAEQIEANDWRLACKQWLYRLDAKRSKK